MFRGSTNLRRAFRPPSGPRPLPQPISEYGFNEGSGTVANDEGGLYDLTASNSSSSWEATGKNGSGARVQHTGPMGPNVAQAAYTVMFWVRRDANWTDWAGLFGNAAQNMYIEAQSATANYAVNFYNGSGSATSATSLAIGTWYHVACVQQSNGNTQVYINGVAEGTTSSGGTSKNFSQTTGTWVIAGSAATAGQNSDFNGAVDELRVFDTSLTATEITTWMNTPIIPTNFFTGTAGLSGSGTLSFGAALPALAQSVALSGSGTLSLPGPIPSPVQSVQLSGSGTLTVPTRIPGLIQSLALSGDGTLTLPTQVPKAIQSVQLSGSGTLSLAAISNIIQTVQLSGSGTLDAQGTVESRKSNNAEGYTVDETAITTGNSGGGSGDAWQSLAGTITADFDRKHNGKASIRMGATTGTEVWTRMQTPASRFLVMRRYVYLTGRPSQTCEWVRPVPSGGGASLGLNMMTDGKVQWGHSPFTASSAALPLNQWFREEFIMDQGGGGSSIASYKVYDVDETTVLSTLGPTTATTAVATTFVAMIMGKSSAAGNLAEWWQDDLEIASGRTTEIGPYTPANVGTGDLSGSGTLTLAQMPGPIQSLGLSGSGTLTAAGIPTPIQTVQLSGSGTLTVPTRIPALTGAAAFSGSGTLSLVGVLVVVGSISLSGSGTLTAVGIPTPIQTLVLSGSGTLAFSNAIPGSVGTGSNFNGSGTLTTTGVPSLIQTVSLSGSGTLTVPTRVPTFIQSASYTGSGTLTLPGAVPRPIQSVDLSGSGTISFVSIPRFTVAAAFTGTGNLTFFASGSGSGTAILSGSGTLAAVSGGLTVSGAAGLSGSGSLVVATRPILAGVAGFSGSGVLTGTGLPAFSSGVGLSGTGTLTGLGRPSFSRSVSLSGTGTLGLRGPVTTRIFKGNGTPLVPYYKKAGVLQRLDMVHP